MARSTQPGIAANFGGGHSAGFGEGCGQLPLRHCRAGGGVPYLVPQRGVCAARIIAAARSGTYVNEWGWSALPMTHSFFPARTGGTMRSPPWEFRTRGPKKSPATTLTVLVGEASRPAAVRCGRRACRPVRSAGLPRSWGGPARCRSRGFRGRRRRRPPRLPRPAPFARPGGVPPATRPPCRRSRGCSGRRRLAPRERVPHLAGVLDVGGQPLHEGMLRAAARAGEDPDAFALPGKLLCHRPANGTCSGDNIKIVHDFSLQDVLHFESTALQKRAPRCWHCQERCSQLLTLLCFMRCWSHE